LEGDLLALALESLQIDEEFSKSMQTTGVPLRVIRSSFDEWDSYSLGESVSF